MNSYSLKNNLHIDSSSSFSNELPQFNKKIQDKQTSKIQRKNKPICILEHISKAKLTGRYDKRSIVNQLGRRKYRLSHIIPSEEVLTHIFLGFTQDGQYLLSYRFVSETMYFYIWIFNYFKPLKLVSEHIIYQSGNIGTLPNQIVYLYGSTAIHLYQWPDDHNHLLILTIPENPQPSVINLACIHIDKKKSYLLKPGIITFSVVGWMHKLSIGNINFDLKDYFNPGKILFGKSVCTFHTGTEIVCLQIKKTDEDDEYKVSVNILDIEQILFDTLSSKNFNPICNYEVLVCGIDHQPLIVYAFIKVFHPNQWACQWTSVEFVTLWNVEEGNNEVEECESLVKIDKKKEFHVHSILKKLFESLKSDVYSLNNMSFLETQVSYDSLNSPVDNISITLGP